jgi:hypothetical protein
MTKTIEKLEELLNPEILHDLYSKKEVILMLQGIHDGLLKEQEETPISKIDFIKAKNLLKRNLSSDDFEGSVSFDLDDRELNVGVDHDAVIDTVIDSLEENVHNLKL